MGIRIHKILGYGLTDVKVEDYQIVDERFDQKGYTSGEITPPGKTHRQLFLNFCKERLEKYEYMLLHEEALRRNREWRIYDSICFDPEYGKPEVFMISPPFSDQYSRYDDIIDYHEEAAVYLNAAPRVVEIPGGIYPWSGLYFDRRTGKGLPRIAELKFMQASSIMSELDDDDKGKYKALLDEWARKEFGFDGLDHALENVGPMIPNEVKALCNWLHLFKEEKTIWQLRPLLYVYWS
jgi:hypothetical protein